MFDEKNLAKLWSKEYEDKGIPSSFREEPSGSVVEFVTYLTERGFLQEGKVIDLGCGTGRNSIFLAEQGLEVFSIDFVSEMIQGLRRKSEVLGLTDRIHTYCQSVTSSWPFNPAEIDYVIDTFCYKHQVTNSGKLAYREELARVVKPGGFYLLTLAGIDDGYYGSFLAVSPQPIDHLIIDPAIEVPSILYTKEDVLKEFNPYFRLFHYRHKLRDGLMHGKIYKRSTHLFIFSRRYDKC